MENLSYSSYPDSGNSSPRSREIDCENASWDEPPTNYKVKFMCSYGGKIHPRPHDNQLTYVGGDTKILAVDRNIRFSGFMQKLSSLCDSDACFKYQLPGEDLDALISVTTDEDLEHMMLEYDRLYRASAKPARLRLFLFPVNPPSSTFGTNDTKSERQWFVDALNSVQIQNLETSSPSAATSTAIPDFLFGLEKSQAPPVVASKLQDPPPQQPTVPEITAKEFHAGSDCGSEDRHVIGDPVVSPAEFQRLQISSHDQAMFNRKIDETNPRGYSGEYYQQKLQEKLSLPQPTVPVQIPGSYFSERPMNSGLYPMAAAPGNEQQVYLIPTAAGMYQAPAMRPVTGQVGQGYYGMQRVVPEVYREQPMYNLVPQQSIQQPKIGGYSEAIGMVRPQMSGGIGVTEAGYAQVGYDGAGRQVYYTAPGGVVPQYQAVSAAMDVRQSGGALNQEG
ncbi:unnamed protein product [Ilex paraguariensis]|uniref:PB1 domain-containing protein n=1 Tax=Ilex paraguariensis TaxID=185542 RepID=A0ABC8UK02_9AQUA